MTLTMAEIPLAAIPCSQCGHLVGLPDVDASAVCSCGTTVYDIKAIRAAKDQVTGTTIEALLDDLDNLDRP